MMRRWSQSKSWKKDRCLKRNKEAKKSSRAEISMYFSNIALDVPVSPASPAHLCPQDSRTNPPAAPLTQREDVEGEGPWRSASAL